MGCISVYSIYTRATTTLREGCGFGMSWEGRRGSYMRKGRKGNDRILFLLNKKNLKYSDTIL